MKIPTQTRNSTLQFNLTPMIDIVFLLIIFFLVASHLSSSENQEAIQLAKASGASYDAEESPRRIVVTIDSEGKLQVGTKFLTVAEFATQIRPAAGEKPGRDLEVRLRADKRVRYEKVEPLLVECAKAGITQIKFNVLPGTE
jgi:biopolymer transport protein ExbD